MSPNPPNPEPPPLPHFDVHTIETPEQTQLQFQLAGIGSRFLAMMLDTLFQALAGLAVFFILTIGGWSLTGAAGSLAGLWATALIVAAEFCLYYGYFVVFELAWHGQTPGKRIIGLRVIKETGRPLAPAETIGRNLLRIVDQLPGFYAVGLVTAILNRQSKRLGDYLAGSIVIREEKDPALWLPVDDPTPAPSTLAGHMLSPAHAALIEKFTVRRSELPVELRSQMAHQILWKIQQAGELPPMVTGSPEAILDDLLRAHRASGGYR